LVELAVVRVQRMLARGLSRVQVVVIRLVLLIEVLRPTLRERRLQRLLADPEQL
jgi:hypothetical protein